jgi:hypothetical protein
MQFGLPMQGATTASTTRLGVVGAMTARCTGALGERGVRLLGYTAILNNAGLIAPSLSQRTCSASRVESCFGTFSFATNGVGILTLDSEYSDLTHQSGTSSECSV